MTVLHVMCVSPFRTGNCHGDGPMEVKKSGCHGFCEMGPLMRIEPLGVLYTKVKVEDCEEIFEKTQLYGNPW